MDENGEIDESTSVNPNCLEPPETPPTEVIEAASVTSREICTSTNDTKIDVVSSCPEAPIPFEVGPVLPHLNSENMVNTAINTSRAAAAPIIFDRASSVIIRQPLSSLHFDFDLPSPASVISGQPQPLFVQALAKLNEGSLNIAVTNHFRATQLASANAQRTIAIRKSELSPPDSLASAPPSYSFVLRQMAARRRPRIVGTFIPSPSFVQHTPPPNYATAFDFYVENAMPRPPTRVYNFGFASMPVVCPDCGYAGMSMVNSRVTICTHVCALVLCVMCCWVCAPLPYILRSCKDVYHYCENCRSFLGMYSPTNPENAIT